MGQIVFVFRVFKPYVVLHFTLVPHSTRSQCEVTSHIRCGASQGPPPHGRHGQFV